VQKVYNYSSSTQASCVEPSNGFSCSDLLGAAGGVAGVVGAITDALTANVLSGVFGIIGAVACG
jgi:hypothetical protein